MKKFTLITFDRMIAFQHSEIFGTVYIVQKNYCFHPDIWRHLHRHFLENSRSKKLIKGARQWQSICKILPYKMHNLII
jgi:hypothetical protein